MLSKQHNLFCTAGQIREKILKEYPKGGGICLMFYSKTKFSHLQHVFIFEMRHNIRNWFVFYRNKLISKVSFLVF